MPSELIWCQHFEANQSSCEAADATAAASTQWDSLSRVSGACGDAKDIAANQFRELLRKQYKGFSSHTNGRFGTKLQSCGAGSS
jgi:hypothetical protein